MVGTRLWAEGAGDESPGSLSAGLPRSPGVCSYQALLPRQLRQPRNCTGGRNRGSVVKLGGWPQRAHLLLPLPPLLLPAQTLLQLWGDLCLNQPQVGLFFQWHCQEDKEHSSGLSSLPPAPPSPEPLLLSSGNRHSRLPKPWQPLRVLWGLSFLPLGLQPRIVSPGAPGQCVHPPLLLAEGRTLIPGVATGVTDTSWGNMAPLRATILVTCWAQAEETSAEGSLRSKAKPAVGMKVKKEQ